MRWIAGILLLILPEVASLFARPSLALALTRSEAQAYTQRAMMAVNRRSSASSLTVLGLIIPPQLHIATESIGWMQKRLSEAEIRLAISGATDIYKNSIPALVDLRLSEDAEPGFSFKVPKDIKDYLFLENDTGDFVRCSEASIPALGLVNLINPSVTLTVAFPSELPDGTPLISDTTRSVVLVVSALSSTSDVRLTWPVPIPIPEPSRELAEIFALAEYGPLFDQNRRAKVQPSRAPDLGEADASDSQSETVDFHRVEIKPKLMEQVSPHYPEDARKKGIEGRVLLKFAVGRNGKVLRAHVISGPAIFRQPAIDAVRQWVFKPAIQKGKPVVVWMTIPMSFTLTE
jgi:TonB family protein